MKFILAVALAAATLSPVAAFDVSATAYASPTAVLSLQAAIARVLGSSPRLGAARAAVAAASGAERQAGAWINPEIGLDAENVAGSGPYRATDSGEFTYAVSQKIEIGKRGARRGVAAAGRGNALLELRGEQLNLVRDVKVTYAEAVAADEELKLTAVQESLAREVLVTVDKRVKAARDPLIYRSQAQVSLASAQLAGADARRRRQLATSKLAALWGGHLSGVDLDPSVLSPVAEPLPLADYRAMLEASPDIARYDALEAARRSSVSLERAQSIPDPTFSVGIRQLRESRDEALTLGVSIPIPLFDRNLGNVDKALAELERVRSEKQSARITAQQSLEEAWQDWRSASAEAQQLHDLIIPAAQEAFDLSRQGYERGRFSYLEILNAQRTLFEARGRYTRSLLRQFTAKAQVERLTTPNDVNQQGTSM